MPRYLAALGLVQVLLTGCATTYLYEGRLRANDSSGTMREHVVYWNRTHRRFWFDSASGSVTLLSACSTSSLQYDEREGGIFFRRRGSDHILVPNERGVCGEVMGAKSVADLSEPEIQLTVYCVPEADEFSVAAPDAYLGARHEPYTIPVVKRAIGEDLRQDAPKRPVCDGN